MKQFIPFQNNGAQVTEVINLEEEKRIEKEALALVDLHDFIKSNPDGPAREIARFMPPVDSRAVNKAIQMIALRDRKN